MLNITITEFCESQEPLILDAWNFTGEEQNLKILLIFAFKIFLFAGVSTGSIHRPYSNKLEVNL